MEQLNRLDNYGFGLNQSMGQRLNVVKANAMGCFDNPCVSTLITLLLLVLLILAVWSVYKSITQRRFVVEDDIYQVGSEVRSGLGNVSQRLGW
jgi:hypothetical protein